jgi:hypothetical protein
MREKFPQPQSEDDNGEGFKFTREPRDPIKAENKTSYNFESKEQPGEAEKEKLICESESFSGLYQVIENIGTIQGSQEIFEAKRLVALIERVRKGALIIDYVTRACGLRETVERLLAENPRGLDSPPPLEAAVALELPIKKENEAQLFVKNNGSAGPEGPPLGEAREAKSLEHADKEKEFDVAPERSPKEPIEPLTEEELDFYHRAQEADINKYDPVYQLNVESTPQKLLNISDPDVEVRYKMLRERYDRFEKVVVPASFEELRAVLENASFVRDKDGTRLEAEPRKLLEIIEKVRTGDEQLVALPDLVRNGVERLIANDVLEKFKQGGVSTVENHEWNIFAKRYPVSETYKVGDSRVLYPEIGSKDISTRDAKIDGELVWSDGEIAVFKSPDGYMSIPFGELILENEKTLNEMKDGDVERQRRGRREGGLRERRIGE